LAAIDTGNDRGLWSSKIGFVLAAAGSAVGLGNIWKYPSVVAENGGAAFLLVYILACFLVGFPVMIAELTIGRKTGRNPVGAFKALAGGKNIFGIIGAWGIVCGVMILSFYLVVAGWTLGYVFEEIAFFAGYTRAVTVLKDVTLGWKNALFALLFLGSTILIVKGGVSGGIERANKIMMPALLMIILSMIVYVMFQDGAMEGLKVYLYPDFSKINPQLVFAAMGQAFFSLSLGMGALITYGSYLNKKQNLPEAAAYVTLSDLGVAFFAGLLIIPAMYVASNSGIQIFSDDGKLIASTSLVFDVLPALFHNMGTGLGLFFGVVFFILLGMAALTSTISLLEVPVSYVIDEWGFSRSKAALTVGGLVAILTTIVAFDINWIDRLSLIFNDIGLPLGGLMICIFLGWFWKTESALLEIKEGFEELDSSKFRTLWPIFITYICPALIAVVFSITIYNLF
jgi:NSS family neurotransmitter:Na+ symporter